MSVIVWKKPALEFLRKSDKKDSEKIIRKINQISLNPLRYIKGLVNRDLGKIRVGDYRCFVDYISGENKLVINTIKHRRNAYKK